MCLSMIFPFSEGLFANTMVEIIFNFKFTPFPLSSQLNKYFPQFKVLFFFIFNLHFPKLSFSRPLFIFQILTELISKFRLSISGYN